MRLLKVTVALVLTMALSACGGGGGDGGSTPSGDGHDHVHGATPTPGGTFSFGQPGNTSEATQTIKIEATDTFRFDPASIAVSAGETVVFEIINSGKEEHEFVLGDLAFQQQHEKDMAEDPHMVHNTVNAVDLPPGETRIVAWKFTSAGEVQYACYTAGHYDSGMFGKVVVG